jgi:hypothetical protein
MAAAAGVVHTIAPTRGAAVIRQLMGEHCAECWVSDCYSSQLLAPAKNRQWCLSQEWRDWQRVIEQDRQLSWPSRDAGVVSRSDPLVETIHHRRRTDCGWASGRRVREVANRLDDLLAEDQTGTAAQNL